ncbi:MAG: GNAT family N-acetyltransferase [Pseudomonadota bacterium]
METTDGLPLVRAMEREDVGEALLLMRELARIEGYLAQLAVTERDLLTHGFGPTACFQAFVAQREAGAPLDGLAVTYLIPWTYDLRPTVVLKELVVAEHARGIRVGAALLAQVARYALARSAARVAWTVLTDNTRAQRFYGRCGAKADERWQNWSLDEEAIRQLSESEHR